MKAAGVSAEAAPVTREELHLRQIAMRGYRRSDGRYEVEGRVVDRKAYDFRPLEGTTVPAGTAIHDMGVRIVFDENMIVHDVETFTDAAPYAVCPEGGRALQSLRGLSMTSGWNREVRSRLQGAQSCTHLMELLGPLATTAFQTVGALRMHEPDRLDANGRPMRIDSCYAYAADGDVVRRRWPQFHLHRETPGTGG